MGEERAGGGSVELRIDGTPVATTAALDPAIINRFSVEGYQGGTGYFDDAYVRRYAEFEPEVIVGDTGVVGIDDQPDSGPGREVPASVITLEQNVPNPLNPETTIAFNLPRAEYVTLQIIDLRGRVVRTLVAETRDEVGAAAILFLADWMDEHYGYYDPLVTDRLRAECEK